MGFILFGSVLALYFLPTLLDPKGTITVNGVPETDLSYRVIAVIIPVIVALLGALLFRVRPWFPRGFDPGIPNRPVERDTRKSSARPSP